MDRRLTKGIGMKIVINVPEGTRHDTRVVRDSLHRYGAVLREDIGRPELSIMSQWADVEDLPGGAYRVTINLPGWAESDALAVLETLGSRRCELAEKPSGAITPLKSKWITVES